MVVPLAGVDSIEKLPPLNSALSLMQVSPRLLVADAWRINSGAIATPLSKTTNSIPPPFFESEMSTDFSFTMFGNVIQ